MKINTQPVAKIKAYENNPRKHPKHQIDALADSIERYGFKVPILVSADNVIVAGHGRLMAAKKANLKDIPTIVVDDLTEEEIREFRLLDNQLSELSEWDDLLLAAEIEATDIDLVLYGFDQHGTSKEEVESAGTLLALSDVTIQKPKTEISHGDVVRLGPHVLVCADVMTDWSKWVPLLIGDMLLVTYGGPFVLVSEKAQDVPMLVVQPDGYIAGHIADKYKEQQSAKD